MRARIILVIFFSSLLSGTSVFSQKPVLKFNKDKKFKIVQFTDTHVVPGNIESETPLKTIAGVLDAEKPDLVIFTGDIVTGPPVKKGWEMVTRLVIERKVPFAVVFGNHDDESDLPRKQISDLIEPLPYNLFVSKVDNITGYGNYVLSVQSASKDKTAALLYCIDSNAYNTRDTSGGYDWIQPDQIAWYRNESEKQKQINKDKPLPALAFFHIPLPEYKDAYINEQYPAVGLRLEAVCSPGFNSGMFDAMRKCGDVMGIFTGHDHNNDYIAYLDGIALAYGRFTGGKTIYGDLESGARIILLTEGSRSFKTWIRTSSGRIFCPVTFPEQFVKK